MRFGCSAVCVFSLALFVPTVSFAQTTRTALIEEQVREKEKELRPYAPRKIESLALKIEPHIHIGAGPAVSAEQGWYPSFAPLPLRGGLSFGAGYRTRLAGGRALTDASLAWSFRGYRQLFAGVDLPRLMGRPLDLRVSARVRDFPRERFFGVGPETAAGDRVSFRLRDADYSLALTAHPTSWLKAGIDGGYLMASVRPGKDARFPSLEQRFSNLMSSGSAEGSTSRPRSAALARNGR